jgi:hypothetical protein
VRYRSDEAWDLAYAAIDAQHRKLTHSLADYDNRERAAHVKGNPYTVGQWRLGPSDAGTCRRKIWYKNLAPAGLKLDPTDNREARMGTLIHDAVMTRLAVLYPWRRFEQKVKVRGLDRPGKYDEYDPITCEVNDLKTAGDWAWDQVDDYGPFESAWKQGFLYGLGLVESGHEVRTVKLTYLKRCNGHDQVFVEDFDIERAKAYREELLVIAQALDIVHAEQQRILAANPDAKYDPGEALPRDRSGPSTDKLCERCEFRSNCWNLVEAKENGRSGESWTMLGPDPEEEKAAWAIQQNVEAKELYGDTKKAKEETETWFEGLPLGRYGDYRLVLSQDYGSKPQYKQDSETLRAMALAGETPDVENMPVPIGPPSRKVQAKRMQKSVLAREERERSKAIAAAQKAAAEETAAQFAAASGE